MLQIERCIYGGSDLARIESPISAGNSIRHRKHLLGLLLLVCWPTSVTTSTADETREGPRPKYSSPIGAYGVGRYYPGKWGVVEAQLMNPSDRPVDLLSLVSFQGQSNIQFGRRVWVPANARRTTWFPVRPPPNLPDKSRSWDLRSFLFAEDSGNETPIPTATGEMHLDSFLLPGRLSPLTGLIADAEDVDDLTHLLWAARLARNLPKTVALLDWARLPPTVESLESLDHLLIASNQILAHPAACAAIREWLHRGGKLWLYLNRVDPAAIEALVGDALQLSVVDSVPREQLQIFSHELRVKQPSGPELQLDHPVELMRVIFSNAKASHSVDDWPVAAWTSVGRGALLVTTLSSPAWLRDRTPQDYIPNAPDDRNDHVRYMAAEPLRELASLFLVDRESPLLSPEQLQQSATEQIGYAIVSRQTVAIVLGLFCLGLTIAGIALVRMGSLEQIGWIGPVGVLLTSVLLLGIGEASRKSVPNTVAIMAMAEASPYSDDLQVSGLAARYSADKTTDYLTANEGGIFWPKLDEPGRNVLRMISTDRSQWELRNLTLPAGKHLVPVSQTFATEKPLRAVATFGRDGLEGTVLTGPLRQVSDGILALPSTQHLAIEFDDATRFHGNADAVLPHGQFLTGAALTDEQRRRSRLYELLFQSKNGLEPYPAIPTLLVWAQPLEMGFRLLDGADQIGSTLVSIPLQLAPPQQGTRIRIPGPFLRYRAAGASNSATFDERKRSWVGPFPTGRDTILAFQLPVEVLPMNVESARLSIGIKALLRELQVIGFADGKPVVLESRQSPMGRIELPITREDVLRLSELGELSLGINISDIRDDEGNRVTDPGESQMWRIDDVQLEITGTTLSP